MKRIAYLILGMMLASQVNASSDEVNFILDVKRGRSAHPVGPISAVDDYKHLCGFPTFVEITERGSAVMMKQATADLEVFARFSGNEKPIRLYSLNHYFFTRAKNPGLYQPDYPVYARDHTFEKGKVKAEADFYYPGVTIMGRDEMRQAAALQKVLHGVNILPDPKGRGDVLIYNPECNDIGQKDLAQAQGELITIGGQLRFGDDAPFLDSEDYCGEVRFSENLRGVVFTLDAFENASTFIVRTRELTWTDIEYMKLKGEYKIQVK